MKTRPKKILTKFVNLHNQLSDKNFIWFPFLFLKLRPDQLMTWRRVIVMTFCFACYGATILSVKDLMVNEVTASSIARNYAFFGTGFFLWFSIVTSTLWNIRARSYQKSISPDS